MAKVSMKQDIFIPSFRYVISSNIKKEKIYPQSEWQTVTTPLLLVRRNRQKKKKKTKRMENLD